MKILTLAEEDKRKDSFYEEYADGIPLSYDPYEMIFVGFQAKFGMPQTLCCANCGEEITPESGWITSLALEDAADSLSGYALLYHCRDCDPHKLASKLDGLLYGNVIQHSTNEDWKFSQGEL